MSFHQYIFLLRKFMFRRLFPTTISRVLFSRERLVTKQPRFMSAASHQFEDPSLDAMEAMLNRPTNGVSEVCSDEIVRIPSQDGIAVGSWVRLGEAEGVVIQFNSKLATVALTSKCNVSRNSSFEIESDKKPMSFSVNRIPFTTSHASGPPASLFSGVPAIDLLLAPYLKIGSTVGIYSQSFVPKLEHYDANLVHFPSRPNQSAMEMYIDLIDVCNRAIASCESVTVVADLRLFDTACKSLEYQAGCPLPVSPQSLVGSLLQLSHSNEQRSVSVVALLNSASDFHYEASQSVDIGIEVEGSIVTNLRALLSRFAVKKSPQTVSELFIKRIVDGFKARETLQEKQAMGVFVDYWEQDEESSFDTVMKILTLSPSLVSAKSDAERTVLLRALSVLFFNKSPKRNSATIEKFPKELLDVFNLEEDELMTALANFDGVVESNPDLMHAMDQALLYHRTRFELTNPLAAM